MALSDVFGNVSSRWNITMKKALASVTDNALAIFQDYGINFTFGSSDNQANAVYSAELSIAASATTTLNLDDGSLKDLFGDNFSLAKVKGFRIIHLSTSAASSSPTRSIAIALPVNKPTERLNSASKNCFL